MTDSNLNTKESIEYRIENAFVISNQFQEYYQKSRKDNTLKNLDNDLAKIAAIQEKIIEKLKNKTSDLNEKQENELKTYFTKTNDVTHFKNTPEKEEEILKKGIEYFKGQGWKEKDLEMVKAYGQMLRVQNRKETIKKTRLQLDNKNKININEKEELDGNDKIVFDEIIKQTFVNGKDDPIKRAAIFKKGEITINGNNYKINPQLAVLMENEIQKQTKQQNTISKLEQTLDNKKSPNHVNITDIHSDINHFITAMIVSGACEIGNPKVIYRNEKGEEVRKETEGAYACPNLKFNPDYKGLLTFTGDLIQSHGALATNDSIAIMLTMEAVIKEAKEKGKEENIQYIAGNHEMESLNFTENPVVNKCVNRMVDNGQIKYCYYNKDNDIMFSHTVMNENLIMENLADSERKSAGELMNKIREGQKKGEKYELTSEDKKLLTEILNENLKKPLVPKGASQEQINGIKQNIINSCKNAERCFEEIDFIVHHLDELKKPGNEKFYNDNKEFYDYLYSEPGKKNIETVKTKWKDCKDLLKKKEEELTPEERKKRNEFLEAYAEIQIHNPKAKNIEIMNDGEMMNYSGGLYGYGKGDETLNVGTQWVGHRPALVQVGFNFQKADTVYDVNINGATVRQTDMFGKPDTSSTNLKMVIDGDPYVFSDLAIEDKKLAEELGVLKQNKEEHVTYLKNILTEYIKPGNNVEQIEIDFIREQIESGDEKLVQEAYDSVSNPELLEECKKELIKQGKLIESRANQIVEEKQKNQQVISQAVANKIGPRGM